MDRFRFTNADGTVVRLELNDPTGWFLGRGVNLSRRVVRRTLIQQDGVDGATLATSDLDVREMVLPLGLGRQASSADMLGLYEDLVTELDRLTNTIEIRPSGFPTSFFVDTFRADVDSLVNGQDLPDIFAHLEAGEPLEVVIPRQPKSRGAGSYL